MKRLILIRHAKSSWACPDLEDIDRPLNKRGKRDVPKMAERLCSVTPPPDHFLTSPAKRTRKTAKVFARHWHQDNSHITINNTLYLAELSQLIALTRKQDNRSGCIAICGHNPGLTEFCTYLTNSDIKNIQTTGIAIIDLNIDQWESLATGTGKLIAYLSPKQID